MIINVKVIPNASKPRIVEEKDLLKIYLKSPPVDGKANKELIEVLAEHFNVKKKDIEILRGQTSRNKTVKVNKLTG